MRPKTASLASSKRIAFTLYQSRTKLQIQALSSHAARHGCPRPLSVVSTRRTQYLGRQPPLLAAPRLAASTNSLGRGGRRHYSSEGAPTPSELQTTCLAGLHIARGAKMVPFAGFSMPVLYSDQSLSESHLWTRSHASIFDVSHMVQQFFRGPKAGWFLERVTPCPARTMEVGTGMLSALMLEDTGGIMDDCLISRIGEDHWFVVTNAGRRKEDQEFLRTNLETYGFGGGAEGGVQWGSGDGTGMIAVQGPEAREVVERCLTLQEGRGGWDEFWFGRIGFAEVDLGVQGKVQVLVSRGGYTGEDGFEVGMIDPDKAPLVVEKLLEKGDGKVKLAGLGARDSLRLEAGMCLYGHDLDTDVTPVEAGLSWIIPKERRDPDNEPPFPGKERILGQLRSKAKGGTGVEKRRIGLVVEKGPPAREGAGIVLAPGAAEGGGKEKEPEVVGVVTSGCPSPSTGKNIAMGYVNDGLHKAGTELEVLVRGKRRKAVVTKMPFVESRYYKKP